MRGFILLLALALASPALGQSPPEPICGTSSDGPLLWALRYCTDACERNVNRCDALVDAEAKRRCRDGAAAWFGECRKAALDEEPGKLREQLERQPRLRGFWDDLRLSPHERTFITYTLPKVTRDRNGNRAGSAKFEDHDGGRVMSADRQPYNKREVVFQISFKAPVAEVLLDPWTTVDGELVPETILGLYVGFTQKSHWDLFDFDNSAPFTETNYSPELWFRWRVLGPWFPRLRIGVQHQSNGQVQQFSRSWNRVFADVSFFQEIGRNFEFYLRLKAWTVLRWGFEGNPDLKLYAPPYFIDVSYRWGSLRWESEIRFSTRAAFFAGRAFWKPGQWRSRGYVLADVSWGRDVHCGLACGEETGSDLWYRGFPHFYFQLFYGYNEALITYDMRTFALRWGVALANW